MKRLITILFTTIAASTTYALAIATPSTASTATQWRYSTATKIGFRCTILMAAHISSNIGDLRIGYYPATSQAPTAHYG